MSDTTTATQPDQTTSETMTQLTVPDPIVTPASSGIDQLAAAVCQAILEIGTVEKTETTGGPKFKYLSEADITAAVRRPMASAGLFVYPRLMEVAESEEYKTGSGATMTWRVLKVTYRLCHKSGQSVDVVLFGEGADAGDKVYNKCMTAAWKYMLREVFACSGGDDPDATDADKVARGGKPQQMQGNKTTQQSGKAQQQLPKQESRPEASLEERHKKCLDLIGKATTHEGVFSICQKAEIVFKDGMLKSINEKAIARRYALFTEQVKNATDLETLNQIEESVAQSFTSDKTLGDKLGALIANKQAEILGASSTETSESDQPVEMTF